MGVFENRIGGRVAVAGYAPLDVPPDRSENPAVEKPVPLVVARPAVRLWSAPTTRSASGRGAPWTGGRRRRSSTPRSIPPRIWS